MQAGKLRHFIRIFKPDNTLDGLGQETDGLTLVAEVYADIRCVSGRDFFAAQQQGATATHRVHIRHHTAVKAGMLVVWGQRQLFVQYLTHDHKQCLMTLFCDERL